MPRSRPKLPGKTQLTDLQVDGTTVVVDETNNRLGIGTSSPGAQLEIHDTTTSSANTGGSLRLSANDGAVMGDSHRLGVIEFTGAEDTSNTQTVGARIEALTEAAWTNAENGAALYFYTTDGNASQTSVLKLDSNKKATFAGEVVVGGTTPKVTIGDGGEEDTMLVFDGNAADWRIGVDDSADELEIGVGTAHDTTSAIVINASAQVTGLKLAGGTVAQASDHIMFFDGGSTGQPKVESIDDFLSAIAGSGISVSSSQLTASGGASADDANTILHMQVFS